MVLKWKSLFGEEDFNAEDIDEVDAMMDNYKTSAKHTKKPSMIRTLIPKKSKSKSGKFYYVMKVILNIMLSCTISLH